MPPQGMYMVSIWTYILRGTFIIFVTAYTLASLGIKRIKTKRFYTKLREDQSLPLIPKELQEIILQELMLTATTTEIFRISLTCKDWSNYFSNSLLWDKRKHHIFDLTPRIENAFDHGILYSAKMTYFYRRRKAERIHYTSRGPEPRFNEKQPIEYVYGDYTDNFYVPWLDHNLIRRPETVWQLIRTITNAPHTLFKFIVQVNRFNSRRIKLDEKNTWRVSLVMSVISMGLSILPFIDQFMAHSPIVRAAMTNSMQNFLEVLWSNEGIPITRQLIMMLPVVSGQLLENSLYCTGLAHIRMLLVLIMMVLNRGIKIALFIATSALIAFIAGKLRLVKPEYWWLPVPIGAITIVIFNPIALLYVGLASLEVFWLLTERHDPGPFGPKTLFYLSVIVAMIP